VNPESIERGRAVSVAEAAKDAATDGAQRRDVAGIAQTREKLAAIAVEQRNVPDDFDSEALVLIAADGEVRAEEDREVDVRLARDAAEQRRLVLDRVRDDVGKTHRCAA